MYKNNNRYNLASALLLGLTLGILLGIPIPSQRGYISKLDNGMGVALVRAQDPSFLTLISDKVVSYASSNSTSSSFDQYATLLNAYGAARDILGKPNSPGFLVMGVDRNIIPSNYLIKVGDLIKINPTKLKELNKDPLLKITYLKNLLTNTMLIHQNGSSSKIKIPQNYFKALNLQEVSNTTLPNKLKINDNIIHAQGNSDGLSLTLYFVDLMTKGELMPKGKVAATGAVASQENKIDKAHGVLAIGSLPIKYAAVLRGDYDLFFIPKANAQEITIQNPKKVIVVQTVEEAIKVLCQNSKNIDEVCSRKNIIK